MARYKIHKRLVSRDYWASDWTACGTKVMCCYIRDNWRDVFQTIWNGVKSFARNVWENLKNLWGAIKGLFKGLRVKPEIFVHGALCYSFSGQCLFSHVHQDRSANKGAFCAKRENGRKACFIGKMTRIACSQRF